MHIGPSYGEPHFMIDAYNDEHIIINKKSYSPPFFICEDIYLPWQKNSFSAIDVQDFTILFTYQPTLILISTGQNAQVLAPALQALCWENKIGVETMPVGPACRTFNLLVAEARRVAGLFFRH